MKKRSKETKSETKQATEEEGGVVEETEEDTVDKKRSRYILFIGTFN